MSSRAKMTGRATQHGVTIENTTLIAAFHKEHQLSMKAHELRWQAGRFYFVNGRGVKRITQSEAVKRFIRFHTPEYLEGSSDNTKLLLQPEGAR